MHLIAVKFPELIPLSNLLYGKQGTVHYRWEDGSWRSLRTTS